VHDDNLVLIVRRNRVDKRGQTAKIAVVFYRNLVSVSNTRRMEFPAPKGIAASNAA